MKTEKKLNVTSGQDVTIDPEKIPDYRMRYFAIATLRAVERYFELPGVQEKYEKWLVEYRKEQEEKKKEKKDA